MIRLVSLAAVGTLCLAGSANAFTYFTVGATSGPAPGDPDASSLESTVVTFDSPNAGGIVETDTGTVGVYTGNVANVGAAPAGDTSMYESVGTGGQAVFDFAGYLASHTVNTVSIYLGSIDTYNTIYVLNKEGVSMGMITGSNLPAATGDQGASITNRRLYISNLGPDFGGLEFTASAVAFEFDTIRASSTDWNPNTPNTNLTLPSPAPEPATWALMLAGFGLMGAALRRPGSRQPLAPSASTAA
jgi:hypothetical protein